MDECIDRKRQISGKEKKVYPNYSFLKFLTHELGLWAKEFRQDPLGQSGITEDLGPKNRKHEIVIWGQSFKEELSSITS